MATTTGYVPPLDTASMLQSIDLIIHNEVVSHKLP